MVSEPLRIGVLLVNCVQLLDLAALDLLYMASPEWLEDVGMPKHLADLGRPCEIRYITCDGPDTMASVTSELAIRVNSSMKDSVVAPGNLDILFLPGPSPRVMPPAEEYLDFIRRHNATGTTIMTICTGSLVAAHAGITKGKISTSPRFLIPYLRKAFPDTKLWDDTLRVTRDGNLWMCGGITNGHDLVAEYLRENYPAPLVNTVLGAADVAPRPLQYQTTATCDSAFFVWQIIRAIPSSILRMLTSH
ncbi:ThiJ/PfpI family protein [Penicillium brasilianum]|uniref:ThiJ/PfpI family protein n=1 Tax=Penicillium brasilianum TaxID=104259 RepID=A0A1S9R9S6_PENBI|nr:ThiJ/PfpI family protein [Penicillium brasilianum]